MINKQKPTSRLRLMIGMLISAAAVVLLLWFSDLKAILASLRQLNPWLVLGVTLLLGISLHTRAAAWRTILRDKISVKKSFLILNAGYFINTIFPFRAGEFARAVLLLPSGLTFWEAFPSVVVERMFDIVFAVALFFIGLPHALDFPTGGGYAVLLLGLVMAGFVMLFLAVRYQQRVLDWLNGDQLPAEGVRLWLTRRLRSILSGLSIISHPQRFGRAFLWMALSWIIALLLQYGLLRGFAPQAPLIWAVFAMGALSLGVSIPSSPGNIGVYEASLTLALTALGMDRSRALAYALTSHALSLLVTFLFGSYTTAREGLALRKIHELAQQAEQESV
mgnify:CR=1 FL=1